MKKMPKTKEIILTVSIYLFFAIEKIFGQRGRGDIFADDEPPMSAEDYGLAFRNLIICLIVLWISHKIWEGLFKKEDSKEGDGCIPTIIIWFIFFAIYLVIMFQMK